MPSRMAFFRAFFSVDPAHAGMNLSDQPIQDEDLSGPRACGDEPRSDTSSLGNNMWTPRMRG